MRWLFNMVVWVWVTLSHPLHRVVPLVMGDFSKLFVISLRLVLVVIHNLRIMGDFSKLFVVVRTDQPTPPRGLRGATIGYPATILVTTIAPCPQCLPSHPFHTNSQPHSPPIVNHLFQA